MVNLPLKVLMGLGAAGAVGLGGYGIYAVSRKEETIFDALSKQNVTLLNIDNTDHDEKWNQKVEELGDNNTGIVLSKYKKSTEGDSTKQKEVNRNNLKSICKSLFKDYSSDSSKLNQAKKWCTVDKASAG